MGYAIRHILFFFTLLCHLLSNARDIVSGMIVLHTRTT
jgi:hypothetical protein